MGDVNKNKPINYTDKHIPAVETHGDASLCHNNVVLPETHRRASLRIHSVFLISTNEVATKWSQCEKTPHEAKQ